MIDHKKIVFTGLEKAGKTTIILSFQNNFNIMKTKPTINIDRKKLEQLNWMGMNITSWDFGGQKRFRQQYEQDPTLFRSIHILFFLIDIQDSEKFDESIDYLSKIYTMNKEMSPDAKIVICFHKYDYDVCNDDECLKSIKKLTNQINQMTGDDTNFKFYKTSIFDQSSLIKLFSQTIIRESAKGKMIDTYMNEFAKNTFSSATVLMDKHCLIVGSQASDEFYQDLSQSIGAWLIYSMERMNNFKINFKNLNGELSFINEIEKNQSEDAMIFFEKFQIEDKFNFVLISLSRNKRTATLTKKYLPQLIEQMNIIL